jgi:serine protease Do
MTARVTGGLAAELAGVVADLRRVTVRVQSSGAASGSGVLWDLNGGDDPSGLVITNAHVATRAQASIHFSDGAVAQARVVARDRRRDLAALALDLEPRPTAGCARVRAAPPLRVGELVVAIGHPGGGLVGAATLGIVHTAGGDRAGAPPPWIRADLRLAPGFSGGPLADSSGTVIGINTMMQGGLALAVPAARVRSWLRRTLAPAAP